MAFWETERLRLRPLQLSDLDALQRILSDPAVMRYLETPYDRQRTEAFLRRATGERLPVLGVCLRETGELIGHLIWHPYEGDAWELGWVLGREHWGKGYATELTAAAIRRAGKLGIRALVLEHVPEQAATAAIARRFGFRDLPEQDGLQRHRLEIGTEDGSRRSGKRTDTGTQDRSGPRQPGPRRRGAKDGREGETGG